MMNNNQISFILITIYTICSVTTSTISVVPSKEVHSDQSPLSASEVQREYDNDVIHHLHTPTGQDDAVDLRNLHDDNHDVLEASGHNVRHKRFVSDMMKQQPNKNYQECVTPAGKKGNCKHIQYCVLSDFKMDFWKFLDYFCIIERTSIGVCCPEAITSKQQTPEFVAKLPAQGDDKTPVRGSIDSNEVQQDEYIERPEDRGCGVSTKQFPKISGGRPADPGEWPWMAAIMANVATQAFCGGALITDRHVLTAAHCIHNLKINQLIVRLGEYDFTRYNETRARDFGVIEIRQHADFDPTTYENDIAVLKLHRPTLFNSYVWPICMPPVDDNWEGYRGVVTGWGTQSFGGPHSKILMEVTVPIWNQKQCRDTFTHRVFDSVMCAGGYEGGQDSCQGDSGGPLMVALPNKRWVVVGLVSWGIRCGEPNHPGIYTRVGPFIKWIIENSVF